MDTVQKSLQEPPTEEEFNGLRDMCGELYELGDSPEFWGVGSEINVPGGAAFQVFDFNGMQGIHLEIDAYLDTHLKTICALGQGEELPSPEAGIITAALLPDYYVRTGAGNPEEIPQVKDELERIWHDYEFVCADITWELIRQRIEAYKEIDIL